MSAPQEEMIKKLFETFISKADKLNETLLELKTTMNHVVSGQNEIVQKLDELRLELRELSTRIEMALKR